MIESRNCHSVNFEKGYSKAYIVGGRSNYVLKSVEVYDIKNYKSNNYNNLNIPRVSPCTFITHKYLYVMRGLDKHSKYIDSIERSHTETESSFEIINVTNQNLLEGNNFGILHYESRILIFDHKPIYSFDHLSNSITKTEYCLKQ
jgi:hypothetical protein